MSLNQFEQRIEPMRGSHLARRFKWIWPRICHRRHLVINLSRRLDTLEVHVILDTTIVRKAVTFIGGGAVRDVLEESTGQLVYVIAHVFQMRRIHNHHYGLGSNSYKITTESIIRDVSSIGGSI